MGSNRRPEEEKVDRGSSYKLGVVIYNWSEKAYVVRNCVRHNAKLLDGQFKEYVLPPISVTPFMMLPSGIKIPNKLPIVSYATYVFENEGQLQESLGIAMEVTAESSSSAFRFKHNRLRLQGNWTSQNRHDLQSELSGTLVDYFKADWEPLGVYSTAGKLKDGTPLLARRKPLAECNGNYSELEVNINHRGVVGGRPPVKELHPSRRPMVSRTGQRVFHPDGDTTEVVGSS